MDSLSSKSRILTILHCVQNYNREKKAFFGIGRKEGKENYVSTLFLCNPIKLQECRYRLQLEAKAIKTYLGCHGEFFGH